MKVYSLTILLALTLVKLSAQEYIVADTICADELFSKSAIKQHSINDYEWIDSCTNRFAVVHDWIGRCGIWDMENNRNVTEMDFRDLYFSRMFEMEDGQYATAFNGYRGHKKGVVTVGPSGNAVSVMMQDDSMCYRLDSCRTINEKLTNHCRKLLEKDLKKANGDYGQVLVMESQTGKIKAWVALEDMYKKNIYCDAPLLKHQLCTDPAKPLFAIMSMVESNSSWNDSINCYGVDSICGMFVKDYNWRSGGYGRLTYFDGFKHHSNIAYLRAMEKSNPSNLEHEWWIVSDRPREIDALEIVKMYNAVGTGGTLIIEPSVNTDSIKVMSNTPKGMDMKIVEMFKEYLKSILHNGGVGSKWTSNKYDLSGDYTTHFNCRPTLYDDNIGSFEDYYVSGNKNTYTQVIFGGYFPSDNPQYTICVTMDSRNIQTNGKAIRGIVNNLVKYLSDNIIK